RVDQDAREVKTKFSKSFATWFFPVGEDIRRIVVDWVTYLRQEKLWGLDDPLFPATKIVVGDGRHFRGIGARPQALEQRRPYPDDFQGRLRGCRSALLQPAQLSEDLSPSGRTHLQVSRGVQGLVPKPRPRECSNDIFKLWRCRSAPPGRDHSRAWHVRAARLHLIVLSYCASGEGYIRWS